MHTLYTRERSERECERTSIHIHIIIIIIFRNKEMKIWGKRVSLHKYEIVCNLLVSIKRKMLLVLTNTIIFRTIHPILIFSGLLGMRPFPPISTDRYVYIHMKNINYKYFFSWCHCFSNLPLFQNPERRRKMKIGEILQLTWEFYRFNNNIKWK